MSKGLKLLLDSNRGIYIPRDFVNECPIECKEEGEEYTIAGHVWRGISADDVISCSDPENVGYWDAWNIILDNTYYIDPDNGNKWTLYQDGDLWAVCDELMTEQEKQEFFGEY